MHLTGPFSLIGDGNGPDSGGLRHWCLRAAERVLGLSELNAIYARSAATAETGGRYCDVALRTLGMSVSSGDLSSVPGTGPLLLVANHPTGAADGLALESAIARVRPDTKVLSNFLLERVPQLRSTSIFVDPFGGPKSRERSARGLRQAIKWLRDGHVLIAFPAGEVAHFRWAARGIVEPAWSPTVVRIARRTHAPVLPVWIDGQNSPTFLLAGLVHPRLRTVLLAREFLRRRGGDIRLRVGSPVRAEQLRSFSSCAEACDYVRFRTLLLRGGGTGNPGSSGNVEGQKGDAPAPIAPPSSPEQIAGEIADLPTDALVEEGGDFQVFAAPAAAIPQALREIGRLREVTFREVGEGSGLPLDRDRFDEDYLHLFLWDRRKLQIAGAYRLGFTDQLTAGQGPGGLYTHTLFRYSADLLHEMGPAIELGRSFVCREYQRSFWALLMLWRGIAGIVSRQPKYRRLFGVVSVSADYDDMTRRLLIGFLKMNNFDSRLARLVRPRTPVRLRQRPSDAALGVRMVRGIDELDALVREIEGHRRAIPVLLRQYLNLNARVLGFNIDPAFGHVMDALMLVDLPSVPRPLLNRFFGSKRAQRFLDFHAVPVPGSRASQDADAA